MEKMNPTRHAGTARALLSVSLVSVSLVSVCLSPAQASTVRAGRGVGVVGLGWSRASVLRDMGTPGDHYALPGGVAADEWGDGATRMFYRRGRVVQISTQSLVDPLPGGITMQSSPGQVAARHPGLRRLEYTVNGGGGGGVVDYYDDRAGGIAFEFTRPLIPAPGDAPRMYAVIVHWRGAAVIPDTGEMSRHPEPPKSLSRPRA